KLLKGAPRSWRLDAEATAPHKQCEYQPLTTLVRSVPEKGGTGDARWVKGGLACIFAHGLRSLSSGSLRCSRSRPLPRHSLVRLSPYLNPRFSLAQTSDSGLKDRRAIRQWAISS